MQYLLPPSDAFPKKRTAPDMKYYQQFLLNVLGTIEYLDSLESTFVMDELKQHYGISL